jgi:hypothetical protein
MPARGLLSKFPEREQEDKSDERMLVLDQWQRNTFGFTMLNKKPPRAQELRDRGAWFETASVLLGVALLTVFGQGRWGEFHGLPRAFRVIRRTAQKTIESLRVEGFTFEQLAGD